MKLSSHIANRFLTDKKLIIEMITTQLQKNPSKNIQEQAKELEYAWEPFNSNNFIVAETVMKKLEMIKIKSDLDYSVFAHLPDGKETYVLPNNELIRVNKFGSLYHFTFMKFYTSVDMKGKNFHWHVWWADTVSGKTSINIDKNGEEISFKGFNLKGTFDLPAIKYAEKLVYTLLAFCKLQDVTEQIIQPNQNIGTKKLGKITNDIPIKFKLVDSNWTITSIRTEGFNVTAHFAIRWTGQGRTVAKLVFIEPFRKNGYVRKAKTQNQ